MELTYYKTESAIKQPTVEVGVTTVYFRRNFTQEERETLYGEETELMWVYEEAALSKDEAILYLTDITLAHDELTIDHEYRLALLELGVSE